MCRVCLRTTRNRYRSSKSCVIIFFFFATFSRFSANSSMTTYNSTYSFRSCTRDPTKYLPSGNNHNCASPPGKTVKLLVSRLLLFYFIFYIPIFVSHITYAVFVYCFVYSFSIVIIYLLKFSPELLVDRLIIVCTLCSVICSQHPIVIGIST